MKRTIFSLFLLVFLPLFASATHNRAGEIRVEQIGPCSSLTLRATIITWTKASNTAVDRDTLDLCWGDGFCQKVVRANGGGNGEILPNDIKYNVYIAEHTFPGPATYKISMTDPNRIVGILNVNPPASDNIPFHIETTYTFQDPQFGGCNSTPLLIQPPVDQACIGKPFRHNPNAYDPDGDSLSYQLYVPLQSVGTPVPNYSFPTQIGPGPNNQLQLDSKTGDLLWASPQNQGEYNIAIIIVSWRNRQPIDTTIRDMQILVSDCDNNPPIVSVQREFCVVAGDTVQFTATGTDPDSSDRVRLSALGGPLSIGFSPAIWVVDTGFRVPPITGTFTWATKCEHIAQQPYTVVFKAEDDAQVPLIDLESVTIKVVGPPPLDVQAKTNDSNIEITWERPYICEDAMSGYFYGFSVWRREGSNPFPFDSCSPGLVGKGYQQLVFLTKDVVNGRYYYKDLTVEPGKTYCYRVLAKFARISSGGYPYNVVESLPSQEVCVQLPQSLPIITHVTVLNTDAQNGSIEVSWAKPIAADLDTVLNPPPYRYDLYRANGVGVQVPTTGTPIASFTSNALWQSDTTFTDQNINTEANGYTYTIAFYTGASVQPRGTAPNASSVFLRIISTDRTNKLSWPVSVPWQNLRYDIFRREPGSIQFDSLTSVTATQYNDTGLENEQTYCYYIRSSGTYLIPGIIDPLINLSQQKCGIPIDTLAPCTPNLSLRNICTDPNLPATEPYFNALSWTNPNLVCQDSEDTYQYRLYYSPDSSSAPVILATLVGADQTSFEHEITESLAGCYTVTALDTVGNESSPSNRVCTDNCPLYVLPNTFTPNSDGENDVFKPFPGYRFVESVEFQVFNRWGNSVFETTNPELLWDGKDKSGKLVNTGTYFYTCKAYSAGVSGRVALPGVLSGYIEVIYGE